MLFNQIAKAISFLAIQPPGEEREQQLEAGGVDHGRSLYHGRQVLLSSVDPVMGHYALGCVASDHPQHHGTRYVAPVVARSRSLIAGMDVA